MYKCFSLCALDELRVLLLDEIRWLLIAADNCKEWIAPLYSFAVDDDPQLIC